MQHPKLNIWIQSGGHADGNPNLLQVALRELDEEAGILPGLHVPDQGQPFDLDIHHYPAREKNGVLEPEHLHYDMRFLVEADDTAPLPQSPEGITFQWFDVADCRKMFRPDGGRARMMNKMAAQ